MQSNFWAGSKNLDRHECTTHANIVEILCILAQKTASLMVLPVQEGRSVMIVFGACFHGTMHQKTVSLTDPPVYIVNTAFQFFTSDLEPKSYRSKISGLTNPIRL